MYMLQATIITTKIVYNSVYYPGCSISVVLMCGFTLSSIQNNSHLYLIYCAQMYMQHLHIHPDMHTCHCLS